MARNWVQSWSSGDKVRFASNAALDISGGFSIAFWALRNNSDWLYAVSRGNTYQANKWGVIVSAVSQGYPYWTFKHGGSEIIAGHDSIPNDSAWHHLAVTADGTNYRFYSDGVLRATVANTSLPTGAGEPLDIGWEAGDNGTWGGDLDDLGFWPTDVLTLDEIVALYRGAHPREIRNDKCQLHAPLLGLESPEVDFSVNRFSGTVTGTSRANSAPTSLFLPIIATEPPVSVSAVEKSGSDTLTPAISDAVSALAASSSVNETLTPSLSEAVTDLLSKSDVADTLTPGIAESVSDLLVSVSVAETLTPAISDLVSTLAAIIAASDSLSPSVAEAVGDLKANLDVSETLTPSLSESPSIFGTMAVSDVLTPNLSEGVQLLVMVDRTDDLTPSIADVVSSIAAVLSVSDTLTPSISEAAATILAQLNVSDSLTPAIAEAIDILSIVNTGDTLTPNLSENVVTLLVSFSASDGLTVSVTDLASVENAGGSNELVAVITIKPALSSSKAKVDPALAGSTKNKPALAAKQKTIPALKGKPTIH